MAKKMQKSSVKDLDAAIPPKAPAGDIALILGKDADGLHILRRRSEEGPIEEGCDCRTCARFSRAYLWHLFKAHEMLAISLTAEHNLRHPPRLLQTVPPPPTPAPPPHPAPHISTAVGSPRRSLSGPPPARRPPPWERMQRWCRSPR